MSTITVNHASIRATYASDIIVVDGIGVMSAVGPVNLENDQTPLPEGIEAQTRLVLTNMEAMARAAGMSRDNVIAVRVHMVDIERLFDRMNAAYLDFFPPHRKPVRSVIGCVQLPRGAQIEMEFTFSENI